LEGGGKGGIGEGRAPSIRIERTLGEYDRPIR